MNPTTAREAFKSQIEQEFVARNIDRQYEIRQGTIGEFIRNENLAWLNTVIDRAIELASK